MAPHDGALHPVERAHAERVRARFAQRDHLVGIEIHHPIYDVAAASQAERQRRERSRERHGGHEHRVRAWADEAAQRRRRR